MIWGAVAAKAKTGLEAAESKSVSTVSEGLKRVISLSILIVLGTVLNMYQSDSFKSIFAEAAPETHPQLEQSNHLPSYYDTSSAHYLGGAVNAALESFKSAPEGAFNQEASVERNLEATCELGSNPLAKCNVQKNFKKAFTAYKGFLIVLKDNLVSMYEAAPAHPLRAMQARNARAVEEYIGLVFITGCVVGYYITFKGYQASIVKAA